MDSIADRINQYLENKQINFRYEGNITFHENLKFFIGSTSYTTFVEQKFLEEARIDAFNTKYGHYNYSEDLRSSFPNWGSRIKASQAFLPWSKTVVERMRSDGIIPKQNVILNVGEQFVIRSIGMLINELTLQRVEVTLHRSVFIRATGTAHALSNIVS